MEVGRWVSLIAVIDENWWLERILKVVLREPQDTNTERNNIAEVISR